MTLRVRKRAVAAPRYWRGSVKAIVVVVIVLESVLIMEGMEKDEVGVEVSKAGKVRVADKWTWC